MQTAKIQTTGHSQTVHLPQGFRFQDEEVIVKHFGNGVLLLPKAASWQAMQQALDEFEDQFTIAREGQKASRNQGNLKEQQ